MAQTIGMVVTPPRRTCYAHTVDGVTDPSQGWETVDDHLRRVSIGEPGRHEGAEAFASTFGAGAWGRLAGLWHDLGKYGDAFQDYLLHARGIPVASQALDTLRVDHSTFGAKHAINRGELGWILGYVIAGHHGGMPDFVELETRLAKEVDAEYAPAELLAHELPPPPALRSAQSRRECAFQLAFFTRMVFSALVDADFLATESFMAPWRRTQRVEHAPPTLTQLKAALDGHLARLVEAADPTPVNTKRAEVLAACRPRATDAPGFFSLTVPTGGGKTLSSLAFGLDHAVAHDHRRIIYAIPFTSIIEQNAAVFRDALAPAGENSVLEHHINFEAEEEDRWSRLASENWDAPLVVTTNVQLYESLFHNRPGRCRKLHQIARSVIILDEAQSLPVDLLEPTLMALRELVRNYRCTVVLCTATQPAVIVRDGFPIGVPRPTEIVPDVRGLFSGLDRTTITSVGTIDDASLASELAAEDQALCIVHSRRQARELFNALVDRLDDADAGCFHLSTLMCAEHRTEVIVRIRNRLKKGLPCRVVSTSLIEAGVDVDFPVVYRAIAGLDSIAQAAGRCNREGRCRSGRVIVFEPEAAPPVFAHESIRDARSVMREHEDLLSPEAIETYFREHYWQKSSKWDEHGVMECFAVGGESAPLVFNFRAAADRYRLIRDAQTPIVVPWGIGAGLVEDLQRLTEPADRTFRRRCQRFTVGVHHDDFEALHASGAIRGCDHAPGVFVLAHPEIYDESIGLDPQAEIGPEWLIEGGL